MPMRVNLYLGCEEMTFKQLLELPNDGRVIVYCKAGKISSLRVLYDNEYVATLEGFIELMLDAGHEDAIIRVRQLE